MTTETKKYKCVICGADVPNYEEKWAVGNFFEVMEPPFCSDKCKALIFNAFILTELPLSVER